MESEFDFTNRKMVQCPWLPPIRLASQPASNFFTAIKLERDPTASEEVPWNERITFPKTNELHLKIDGWDMLGQGFFPSGMASIQVLC